MTPFGGDRGHADVQCGSEPPGEDSLLSNWTAAVADGAGYRALRTPELRRLCGQRGLCTDGFKKDLVQRLEEADSLANAEQQGQEFPPEQPPVQEQLAAADGSPMVIPMAAVPAMPLAAGCLPQPPLAKNGAGPQAAPPPSFAPRFMPLPSLVSSEDSARAPTAASLDDAVFPVPKRPRPTAVKSKQPAPPWTATGGSEVQMQPPSDEALAASAPSAAAALAMVPPPGAFAKPLADPTGSAPKRRPEMPAEAPVFGAVPKHLALGANAGPPPPAQPRQPLAPQQPAPQQPPPQQPIPVLLQPALLVPGAFAKHSPQQPAPQQQQPALQQPAVQQPAAQQPPPAISSQRALASEASAPPAGTTAKAASASGPPPAAPAAAPSEVRELARKRPAADAMENRDIRQRAEQVADAAMAVSQLLARREALAAQLEEVRQAVERKAAEGSKLRERLQALGEEERRQSSQLRDKAFARLRKLLLPADGLPVAAANGRCSRKLPAGAVSKASARAARQQRGAAAG